MVKQQGHLLMEFTQRGKFRCVDLSLCDVVHPFFFIEQYSAWSCSDLFEGLCYVPIKTFSGVTCPRESSWCFGGVNLNLDSICRVLIMITFASISLQNDNFPQLMFPLMCHPFNIFIWFAAIFEYIMGAYFNNIIITRLKKLHLLFIS